MLEVENNAILELKRGFHVGGVSKYVFPVQMNECELYLLQGEFLTNARPWPNSKGYQGVRMPLFLFFTIWIEPLWPELVWLWKILWIF